MYSFKCELIEPCIVRERQSIWFWIKRYWIRKQGDDDFVQYRHIYIFIYILSHSLGLGRNNITILWMDTTDKSSPFCRNLSKHKYLSQWNTAPKPRALFTKLILSTKTINTAIKWTSLRVLQLQFFSIVYTQKI